MLLLPLLLFLQACLVSANTEKTIFLGPSSVRVPVEHPTLEDLQLEGLSPQHWSLRAHIQAEFPTNSSQHGKASWYLLHRLQEGQRYEVRICWAATQPTSFRLYTYDLATVFETPELITSLAEYSEAKQRDLDELEYEKPDVPAHKKFKHTRDDLESTLFLQVFAAADYYTMNKTLMEHPLPVPVDIILDPYIFNILPRSLIPTIAYIILLAIGAWYLAKYISKQLQYVGKEPKQPAKKEKKNA